MEQEIIQTPRVFQQGEKVQIDDEHPSILLCVYGTLKEGLSNWSYLLEGRSELIGSIRTEPIYTMLGKGCGYPIVVPNGKTAIECDIIEVKSNSVLDRVHRLEGCSGVIGDEDNWYDVTPIETKYGVAYMYIQQPHVVHGEPIPSGNWKTRHF